MGHNRVENKGVMEMLIFVVVLVVLLALFVVTAYNGLIKLRNAVEEAFSTMDVYMKKRFDLIPNLVETVKGYAGHEAETLEKIVNARNQAASSATTEERLKNENMLSGALRSLFALSEGYPDLKANQNFLDLQGQLRVVEEDISNSRKYYNGTVRNYNTRTEVFPYNIIAGIFGFTRKPLYEVADEAERENVKVQF